MPESDEQEATATGSNRPGRYTRLANWCKNQPQPIQGALIGAAGAVIAAVLGLTGALTVPLLGLSKSTATTVALPTTASTTSAIPISNEVSPSPVPTSLLVQLESADPAERAAAVIELRYLVRRSEVPEVRRVILQRLATFVKERAPANPPLASLDYCLQDPPLRFPTEVALALQAIGRRLDEDSGVALDLSYTNLAYADLRQMDLRNVSFVGTVLCRTFMNESRFDGATFDDAIMRFVLMDQALGLTALQLQDAYTLFSSSLPPHLAPDPALQRLLTVEPEVR